MPFVLWATLSGNPPGPGGREMHIAYLSIPKPDSTMELLTDDPMGPPSATDEPGCLTEPCFSVGNSAIKNPDDRFHFFSIQCLSGMTKYMMSNLS